MTFDAFLDDAFLRNEWLAEPDMKVYVRRSVRYIDGVMMPALDIGSVEVDEDRRGQGVFKKFLRTFENAAKCCGRIVYVESILEPRLEIFLLKNGYKRVPGTADIAPSVYKVVP